MRATHQDRTRWAALMRALAACAGAVVMLAASPAPGAGGPFDGGDRPVIGAWSQDSTPISRRSAQKRSHPVVLIGGDLRTEEGELTSLDGRSVGFRDALDSARSRPASELLAVVPADWLPRPRADAWSEPGGEPARQEPSAYRGIIELTSGERYPGDLARTAPVGDAGPDDVLWSHPMFGTLRFSLEDVRRIVMPPPQGRTREASATPMGDRTDDEVLLLNGDRIAGFIERIGAGSAAGEPDGRAVVIEGAAGAVTVATDRIAEVRLANPRGALAGTVVWLRDGTVARVERLATAGEGRIEIELSRQRGAGETPSASMQLGNVQAVAFGAERLAPVSSLEMVRAEPVGDRRRADPPRLIAPPHASLGAADVELPGPMLVEWRLPERSRRLAGWASMPEEAWLWGDCELVISVVGAGGEGREVLRERLSGSRPHAEFNLGPDALGGGSLLRIVVEPGEYGPIQDRVTLQRAIIAVDAAGAAGP